MSEREKKRRRVPSKTYDRYWLIHIDDNYKYKKDKKIRDSGKWLIFDSVQSIDKLWLLIMDSLDVGLLGPSAKVSTSKIKDGFEKCQHRVICVFTEDFNDIEDVERVEYQIRKIGVKSRLLYKLDADAGKYKKDGHEDLIQLERSAID